MKLRKPSSLPRGWRDVPTFHQAKALQWLGGRGGKGVIFTEATGQIFPSVLNALYIREWIRLEKGRIIRTNSGMVALQQYFEKHGRLAFP